MNKPLVELSPHFPPCAPSSAVSSQRPLPSSTSMLLSAPLGAALSCFPTEQAAMRGSLKWPWVEGCVPGVTLSPAQPGRQPGWDRKTQGHPQPEACPPALGFPAAWPRWLQGGCGVWGAACPPLHPAGAAHLGASEGSPGLHPPCLTTSNQRPLSRCPGNPRCHNSS